MSDNGQKQAHDFCEVFVFFLFMPNVINCLFHTVNAYYLSWKVGDYYIIVIKFSAKPGTANILFGFIIFEVTIHVLFY